MSGKFLSRTTREQGWAVEGALRNPQVHAWLGFLFNRKETLTTDFPTAPTNPHLAQPSSPAGASGTLLRLLYLVACALPHLVPTLRRVPPFLPGSRAATGSALSRGGHPGSLSKAWEFQPSLGQPRRQQLAYPYPAEVRRTPLRCLLPPGFPVAFFLPFYFYPLTRVYVRPYLHSKLYLQ